MTFKTISRIIFQHKELLCFHWSLIRTRVITLCGTLLWDSFVFDWICKLALHSHKNTCCCSCTHFYFSGSQPGGTDKAACCALKQLLTPYQPRHHKILIHYFGWHFIANSICLAELFNDQNGNKEIAFECTMQQVFSPMAAIAHYLLK